MIHYLDEIISEAITFIYNDFHSRNVLIQGDEHILIDMAISEKGHPILILISITQSIFRAVEDRLEDDFISEFTGLTKKQNYEL